MFAIERQNKIKERLLAEKRVDVIQLASLYSVTEVTIRRDLDKLEAEGFLQKTYGGAVLREETPTSALANDMDEPQLDEKRQIGRIAAQMVENGDAIYLSPGATCLEIARAIKTKRCTVVTNDIQIALELRNCASVKVLVIGGDLLPSTSRLTGAFALRALGDIFIGKAFVEVSGVSFDTGYTLDTHEEALILQEVKRISSDIIVVTDYTRFDKTAFARLGGLDFAHKVISNKQISSSYKRYFFEQAVKLFTTYDFE